MQNLLLVIVVFFLILMVLPFIVSIFVSYDVLHNSGDFFVHLFFFKIISYKLKLEGKNIILISKKKKKMIETKISEKQMRFLNQLFKQFKQKLIIKKLYGFSQISLNDAMKSALLTGFVNSIMSSIFAYIKNTKKSAQIGIFCEPAYNEVCLNISSFCAFSITILDILYSLVMSATIIKRSEKYERFW